MRKYLKGILAACLVILGLAGLMAGLEEYAKSSIRVSVKDEALHLFDERTNGNDEITYEVPSGGFLAVYGDGDDTEWNLIGDWVQIASYQNGADREMATLHMEGIIEIPCLDIEEPVWKENSSVAMRYGVIRMRYTAGLQEPGNSVIVGHRNTVSSTIFYNLTDIRVNDRAIIKTPDGKRHEYRVSNTYYCSPYELQDYVGSSDVNAKQITLVTCARERGNCWRFIVVLVPV